MNRRNFLRSGALLLAASALLAGNGMASAHEHRTVGDYSMVVGFLNEPAVQDEVNAVSVRITKPAPADATPAAGEDDVAETPITGLTLNVDVILGDQQVSLPMEGKWGDPGNYVAYFIPTQPGDYSFHVTGEIDGVAIDENAAIILGNHPQIVRSAANAGVYHLQRDDNGTTRMSPASPEAINKLLST